MTVDLARRLTGSLILGIAAGLGIALTPIVWAIGTHADPHALHFALVAIILWLLVRWEQARRGDPIPLAAPRTLEPDDPPPRRPLAPRGGRRRPGCRSATTR